MTPTSTLAPYYPRFNKHVLPLWFLQAILAMTYCLICRQLGSRRTITNRISSHFSILCLKTTRKYLGRAHEYFNILTYVVIYSSEHTVFFLRRLNQFQIRSIILARFCSMYNSCPNKLCETPKNHASKQQYFHPNHHHWRFQ